MGGKRLEGGEGERRTDGSVRRASILGWGLREMHLEYPSLSRMTWPMVQVSLVVPPDPDDFLRSQTPTRYRPSIGVHLHHSAIPSGAVRCSKDSPRWRRPASDSLPQPRGLVRPAASRGPTARPFHSPSQSPPKHLVPPSRTRRRSHSDDLPLRPRHVHRANRR